MLRLAEIPIKSGKRAFKSEEEAIHAVALYLGLLPEEFDEVTYQE